MGEGQSGDVGEDVLGLLVGEPGRELALSSKATTVLDFVRLVGEGTFQPSVVCEIRKDKYYSTS